jgi:uncharacterized protein YkwD
MAVYLIGLFAIFGFVTFSVLHYSKREVQPFNYTPEYNPDLNDNEVELCRLINQHRINLGLNAVIPEKLASEVCKEIILYNIENELPPHHKGWEKRVEKCKAVNGGEICNSNLNTPYGFFTQYLTSKLHKDCIENPIYTHVGICVFEKRNYCIFTKYENN